MEAPEPTGAPLPALAAFGVPEVPTVAVLTSIASTLEDLRARLTEAAKAYADAGDEGRARELYEVERNLLQASRRMTRLLRP
jgi:hypothetical protein